MALSPLFSSPLRALPSADVATLVSALLAATFPFPALADIASARPDRGWYPSIFGEEMQAVAQRAVADINAEAACLATADARGR